MFFNGFPSVRLSICPPKCPSIYLTIFYLLVFCLSVKYTQISVQYVLRLSIRPLSVFSNFLPSFCPSSIYQFPSVHLLSISFDLSAFYLFINCLSYFFPFYILSSLYPTVFKYFRSEYLSRRFISFW